MPRLFSSRGVSMTWRRDMAAVRWRRETCGAQYPYNSQAAEIRVRESLSSHVGREVTASAGEATEPVL